MLAKTAGLALFSVALATVGQLTLKAGMSRVGYVGANELSKPTDLAIKVAKTPQVWLGMGLFIFSAAIWLIVLSRAPLSFAYPFAGLTDVLITAFSRFVLNENVSAARWAGILLIIAGIILVARTAPPGLE